MRNSSLVEWCCADNVAGLKPVTEAMVLHLKVKEVGERSLGSEVVA